MSSSAPSSPRLDAIICTVLIQTLLTGTYAIVFLQTFQQIHSSHNKVYTVIPLLLFSSIIVHLGVNWSLLCAIFVLYSDTREAMVQQSLKAQNKFFITLIGDLSAFIAVWLGDVILLWRCYILWAQNKILLSLFTTLMLGEIVIATLQMSLVLGNKVNMVVGTPMFISVGTTILATALIILRIHQFSKDIGGGLSGFSFTIEVLVESGALYVATQLVDCVLLVTAGTAFNTNPTWQGVSFWIGITTPMAGIAPTLIALRTSSRASRARSTLSQNVSSLYFNRSAHPALIHSIDFDA